MNFPYLRKTDPAIHKLLQAEIQRQKETLDLIPSENVASLAVLETLGSPLTNKYSEGYPEKRYYPGNRYCDEIETLTQHRALQVFRLSPKLWRTNVQPYSGSPANIAVYLGLLEFGDRILGFSLAHGGHLTHGHKVSFSGRAYDAVQYGLDPKTHRINYRHLEELARIYRPKLIISGATAYPRKIDFQKIGKIAQSVDAFHMADISHIAGLIAAGVHPSPFPCADVVTMTTHKTMRGPRGAVIFSKMRAVADVHADSQRQTTQTLSERIDRAVFPGIQGGPHNHQTAAIAVAFAEALKPDFRRYQVQIVKNAQALAKRLMKNRFCLLSQGTDNHLMLIDLKPLALTGKEAQERLEQTGIIVNRNTLPGDTSPFNPSGLRLGTPTVTSRGMKEKEMRVIADFIAAVLIKKEKTNRLKRGVAALCRKFPLVY